MDDERKEVLTEIIEFLRSQYVQYGRAIGYLEQLAGIRAMPRKPPEQLHFLLVPQAGIQRGAIVLGNLEPHTLHTMRVTFHRYHWYLEVEYGGCDNWKHGKITCAMPLCRAQLVPCNYKKNLKKFKECWKTILCIKDWECWMTSCFWAQLQPLDFGSWTSTLGAVVANGWPCWSSGLEGEGGGDASERISAMKSSVLPFTPAEIWKGPKQLFSCFSKTTNFNTTLDQ